MELAIRSIRRVQAGEPMLEEIADIVRRSKEREAARPTMAIADVAAPFSQREHDLLLERIDHVASDWVQQLQSNRHNSEQLEQLVIQRLSKLKADLTQLFLLGHAVTIEAKRGDDVNSKLTDEIAKLAEELQP
ncbi:MULTISPECIES: hypothetical protein [Bradyrhizobium]|uniref:hypothetical protein n=1 Tax=Bradyrhizobium TaxID=374 RepID=UPI001BAAED78|nr:MULTISPECIES: hypothetical protein [Bradyrhizobium]MBR0879664.1 hypothetical protein [Bradyrhizobium liaoningense]MCP1778781.1 RecA/RadA recombinase [Bradyrhizobium japonicum]MCP1958221.1 RecA/RadA recombinase [Bradyrhizobium japonicum]